VCVVGAFHGVGSVCFTSCNFFEIIGTGCFCQYWRSAGLQVCKLVYVT
jgi:hypothetical protein